MSNYPNRRGGISHESIMGFQIMELMQPFLYHHTRHTHENWGHFDKVYFPPPYLGQDTSERIKHRIEKLWFKPSICYAWITITSCIKETAAAKVKLFCSNFHQTGYMFDVFFLQKDHGWYSQNFDPSTTRACSAVWLFSMYPSSDPNVNKSRHTASNTL